MKPTGPSAHTLASAVREIEAHAAESGWDQPPKLFALVPSVDLLREEPRLAAALGLDEATAAGSLTPVEQEQLPGGEALEAAVPQLIWPEEVAGAAAVVERIVLPPSAEAAVPDDRTAALEFAAGHPERADVRLAVGVLRDGSSHCVVRLRSVDESDARLEGADLVPGLVAVLAASLEPAVLGTGP
jgi:hypothetical protein